MDEFLKELVEQIKEKMGVEYVVKSTEVLKNNSKKLNAVLIKGKEYKAVPTIYVDEYYDDFKKGKSTIQDITKNVIEVYQKHKGSIDINIEDIYDYKKVVNRISFKLINAEKNKERLENVVYIMKSNLALVFQIEIVVDDESVGNTLVNKELFNYWNISIEQLYKDVQENICDLEPPVLKNMCDIMSEMLLGVESNTSTDTEIGTDDSSNHPMYVLTNKRKVNGSAVILYPDIEKDIKRVTGASNFYVLPSSIHELILIPYSDEMDKNELRNMIREVNANEVQQEDFLSDDLYFYNADSKEFSMVEE